LTKGTIRARGARDVIMNVLSERKVPRSVWGFKARRLYFLVGARTVEVAVPTGATYYELRDLERKLNAAVDDYERARCHRQ
jgi:hypothetical protein